jgi:hypothetical protein
MMRVKATREGLVGQKTSSGWIIDATTPFVALPSDAALRQWVRVTNPANGKTIKALVLDVGPWNEHDTPYVFGVDGATRPQAESGTDHFGRTTNGAGIDLGEVVWHALDMTDNAEVEWEFLW